MKNYIILTFALILCITEFPAQNTGSDKESNSSILLPVGNVSFSTKDLTTKISYTYGNPWLISENYLKKYKTKDELPRYCPFIFKMEASSSTSNGTSRFFSNGHYVPETNIQAAFGYKISEKKDYENTFTLAKNRQRISNNKKLNHNDISNFAASTSCKKILPLLEAIDIDNDSVAKIIAYQIKDSLKIAGLCAKDSDALIKIIESIILRIDENKELEKENKELLKKPFPQAAKWLIYTGGQRNGRNFRLFDPNQTSFDLRYAKQSFGGGTYFLGVNFNKNISKNTILLCGARVGREFTDNYDKLDKFEVESTEIFTDSNRTDKQSRKIEVADRKGSYHTFFQSTFIADAMVIIKLDSNLLGLGAYYRGAYVEHNDWGINDSWSWGINTSFFNQKGVFSGGIFAELPMPRQEFDYRNWYKRVTIGITTKVNFKSFNFTDLF